MYQSLNQYLLRVGIFLALVFIIVVLLYPVLQNAFLSNIFINLIILLGLAAGYDKNCKTLKPLLSLGFGFVTGGTITLQERFGNISNL